VESLAERNNMQLEVDKLVDLDYKKEDFDFEVLLKELLLLVLKVLQQAVSLVCESIASVLL